MTTPRILGQDRLEVLHWYAQGVSTEALTLWFPYPLAVIRRCVRAEHGGRGHKIGPEQAERIRQLADGGVPCTRIAAELKVHRNSVHRVLAGQTWKG